MAAIAGIFSSQTDDLRFICSMTDLLAHRGPQGDGILWMEQDSTTRVTRNTLPSTTPIAGRATLGYRQMTAQEGAQPLSMDAGRYWIVMDGWITNADALRQQLKQYGQSFTTGSDAELVLAAYKHLGKACFGALQGAFAIAILDTRERVFLLARDAQGLRPCYYWAHRGRLAFASETKALFALPEVRARLDRQAMSEFVQYGRVLSGQRTHFAHIHALPPGHCCLMPLDTPVPLKVTPFTTEEPPAGHVPVADALRTALAAAVAFHHASTSTHGTCLSGGIASAAVTALLRQQGGAQAQLQTFSALCEMDGADSRTEIHAANAALHTLSNAIAPTLDDFMTELDTILWYQDEPFAELGVYGQWCVVRAAREAKTDLLLDGYGLYQHFHMPTHATTQRSLFSRLLGTDDRAEARALARLMPQPLPPQPAALAGPNLQQADRNGMAFSVDIRHPFLDERVVAAAAGLSNSERGSATFVRKLFKDIVPDSLLERPPHAPYTMPLQAWMQEAILPEFLRDIKMTRLPIVPVVNGGELRELVTRQLERPNPALMPLLFRLFIANRWMQRFKVAPVI